MVRYVRDATGRFSQRPHYEPAELDKACEKLLTEFFRPLYGEIPVPIETDDLTRLIEHDVSDFDPGADLSSYGADVEGVTEFKPRQKPRVRIAGELAYDERRENRYRTTLTHEYGHVHFHAYLFEIEPRGADLFGSEPTDRTQVCKRETILNARQTDWMEWQAGYVCGSLLMPVSNLNRVVGAYQEKHKLFGPVSSRTPHAAAVISLVTRQFKVSEDATRIRLSQIGLLAAGNQSQALFT
jgi:hypothetical protein